MVRFPGLLVAPLWRTRDLHSTQESGANDTPLMVEGYLAIAEILDGKDPESGAKRLALTGQALEKLGTDDAKFFAQQHQAVLKNLASRLRAPDRDLTE